MGCYRSDEILNEGGHDWLCSMSRNYKKRTVCISRLSLLVLFKSFGERIVFYPLNLFLILLAFQTFTILIISMALLTFFIV